MQFLGILNDIYDRTGHLQYASATVPPADVQRRIKSFVNRWNRKILTRQGMDPLRRVIITKASVADQQTYGVVLQSIRWITESTTQRRLRKQTIGWYRDRYPAPAQFTGTPTEYIEMGQSRIHTRPSAACELFLVSTQAADVGTVKIEAIRSNGYRVSLSHVLTGLTPVSLSTTITDVIDLVDVRLSATQTGDVTVTQGSGGTELTKIPIGQTYPRFLRYALAPTPAQAITYTIDGIADIVDLTNDYDEPFENADFHDLLIDGIVYEEWLSRGRASEAKTLRAEIELRIRELAGKLLEWPEPNDRRDAFKSFEETIQLPLT
jgi:hypothetical protein